MKIRILNKKAFQYLDSYIRTNYESLIVYSGKGLFNGRCFHNAVHHAIDNDHQFIVACIFRAKDNKNHNGLHFINFCPKENKYIDDSTGHFCQVQDYFFVKKINKKDFFDIDDAFNAIGIHLRRQLPFYLRWFSDIYKF